MKTHNARNYASVNLMNGSKIVATILDPSWIESEQSFYGCDESGDYYYLWDVSTDNNGSYTKSYRRAS